MSRKRIIRLVLQVLVLLIVGVGIAHSARKAALQLTTQRGQISEAAIELETKAIATTDAAERKQMLDEAARLRAVANRFWHASPTLLCLAASLLRDRIAAGELVLAAVLVGNGPTRTVARDQLGVLLRWTRKVFSR